jgi:hypothetical protein
MTRDIKMSAAEDRSLSPEERRQIIELMRETAQGKRPSAGRDEVAEPIRLEIGGMYGRELACQASVIDAEPEAYRLTAGTGEILVRMRQTGEYIYSYGDLVIEAPDRRRGAAFADAMASWLGTPLELGGSVERGSLADASSSAELCGRWAKLGVRDDADGIRWDVYKLFVEAAGPAEVFLRISAGAGRAVLTEKVPRYREPLLVGFDRHLGAGRALAPRTRLDVFGGAWLTVPPDWIAMRLAAHVRAIDPTDDATLEISYQPFPLHPRLPGLPERLALAVDELAAHPERMIAVDRGDFEYVWTEHDFETIDNKTGERRVARGRVLIAANDAVQTLITYSYWPGDEGWAVSAWETIVSTLRLAGQSPAVLDLSPGASLEAAPGG